MSEVDKDMIKMSEVNKDMIKFSIIADKKAI